MKKKKEGKSNLRSLSVTVFARQWGREKKKKEKKGFGHF